MRNINLIESINELQDISQGIEGLVKVEMCEIKNLVNRGIVCDEAEGIINLLERIEGELLNISKEMRNIN